MSFMVFAFSQFTMDLEVLGRLVLGADQLHGFSNTALGATVVLLPSVLLGRPASQAVLVWWNTQLSAAQARWLSVTPAITWKAAWAGGILGVYTHLVLDAIMHADARPWAPFSSHNPFLGLLTADGLNALCFWSLGGGVIVLWVMRQWRQVPPEGDNGT